MAELEDYKIEVLEKEGKTIIPVTTTQAVMTSSGRYLEESIVEMEDVSEGEIVDISPEVEINPSIPSGAEVISCSSMRVGDKYYSMSSVEANPTLSGSETELSGLEIDGTKYAMPSGGGGGGGVYTHYFMAYTDDNNTVAFFSIVNNLSTPIGATNLLNIMKNIKNSSGNNTYWGFRIPASGSSYNNSISGIMYNFTTAAITPASGSSVNVPNNNYYEIVVDSEGNIV